MKQGKKTVRMGGGVRRKERRGRKGRNAMRCVEQRRENGNDNGEKGLERMRQKIYALEELREDAIMTQYTNDIEGGRKGGRLERITEDRRKGRRKS